MGIERSILKAELAAEKVFDYKPKEFTLATSSEAHDYVHDEAMKNDFIMSELAAQQSGVSKLEDEQNQEMITEQVLHRLKDVQERAYKEAYDLGFKEGSERGFQQHRDDMVAKLKTLDDLLASVESMKKDLLRDNEGQFVEFAFEIAKRIALRDLSGNREAVSQVIQQLIQDMQSEQQVVVHAFPDDIPSLEEMQKRTNIALDILKKIKIVADPAIQPGDCVIDLQYGQVNITASDRVERIWQALEKQILINKKS
jgi:flagellar assembly protein FliH